jgi:4-carboxymuconolactone decarboxylase
MDINDSKEFKAGLDLRRQMFGESGADDAINNASDFRRYIEEKVVTEMCFGDVWQRAPLDYKARSMLTIAILATQGRSPQLRYHIMGGLKNGVTKDEIRETLLQVMLYAGIAAAAEGFKVAEGVFEEVGI